MRERYLQTVLQAVGQLVRVTVVAPTASSSSTTTTKEFIQLEGVLHTATPFSRLPRHQSHKYVLKAIRVLSTTSSSSSSSSSTSNNHHSTTTKTTPASSAGPYKPGDTVVLDMHQVVSMHVKSLPLHHHYHHQHSTSSSSNSSATAAAANNAGGFTDGEIAARNATRAAGLASIGSSSSSSSSSSALKGRELQSAGAAWTSAAPPRKGVNMSLSSGASASGNHASSTALKGSIGRWDQFQANEQLFQVKGTYDESIYTTALDTSNLHPDQIRQAEALAKEIESSVSTNVHIAEERGQVVETDYDEEDRYSGVLKAKMNYAAAVAAKTAAPTATTTAKQPAAAADVAPPGFVDNETNKEGNAPKQQQQQPQPSQQQQQQEPPPPVEEKETKEDKKETKPPEAVAEEPKSESGTTEDTKQSEESKPTESAAEEKSEKSEATTEKKEEEAPARRSSSKLNANAKEFTLNVNAKTFTPGGSFAPPVNNNSMEPQPPMMPQQPYGAIDPNTGMPLGMDPNIPPHYMQHGMMGQPGKFVFCHCQYTS